MSGQLSIEVRFITSYLIVFFVVMVLLHLTHLVCVGLNYFFQKKFMAKSQATQERAVAVNNTTSEDLESGQRDGGGPQQLMFPGEGSPTALVDGFQQPTIVFPPPVAGSYYPLQTQVPLQIPMFAQVLRALMQECCDAVPLPAYHKHPQDCFKHPE
uniref:Uncharacterized protein n=1 Tax=Strongyloides papillosus TaxID=174720 RepID=A0A0N5BIP2_STREA